MLGDDIRTLTTSKNQKSTKKLKIDDENDHILRNRVLKAMRFFAFQFVWISSRSWCEALSSASTLQLTEGGTRTPQRKTQNFHTHSECNDPEELLAFSFRLLFFDVIASNSWSKI